MNRFFILALLIVGSVAVPCNAQRLFWRIGSYCADRSRSVGSLVAGARDNDGAGIVKAAVSAPPSLSVVPPASPTVVSRSRYIPLHTFRVRRTCST